MQKQNITKAEKCRVESVMIDFTLPSTQSLSQPGVPEVPN